MADEKKIEKKAADKKPGKLAKLKTYLKEMWGEVKKLSWLSKNDLIKNTAMVLVFVLAMSAAIYVMDIVFSSGVQGLSSLTAPKTTEETTETTETATEAATEAAEEAAETATEAAEETAEAAVETAAESAAETEAAPEAEAAGETKAD